MTGINSVIFYSSVIFGFAGFDNAIAATVAVGAINFVATGMSTLFFTCSIECLTMLLRSCYLLGGYIWEENIAVGGN